MKLRIEGLPAARGTAWGPECRSSSDNWRLVGSVRRIEFKSLQSSLAVKDPPHRPFPNLHLPGNLPLQDLRRRENSNKIEDVQSALIHSAQEVYTEYPDPRRDEWETNILPVLKQAKKKTTLSNLASQIGFSRRELIEWLAGRSTPHRENLKMIASKLRELVLQ
jgi:hypothetical protein